QDGAVSAADASDAYVEAARRRSAAAQDEAQLEDLWRAFAIDAAHEGAASALVEALEARRRILAADEARRAHARAVAAIDPERAARNRAVWRGPPPAVDRAITGMDSEALDALLLEVGMLDTLAARLEARSERGANAADKASAFVDLGRLCAGPVSDAARAESAYARALEID